MRLPRALVRGPRALRSEVYERPDEGGTQRPDGLPGPNQRERHTFFIHYVRGVGVGGVGFGVGGGARPGHPPNHDPPPTPIPHTPHTYDPNTLILWLLGASRDYRERAEALAEAYYCCKW